MLLWSTNGVKYPLICVVGRDIPYLSVSHSPSDGDCPMSSAHWSSGWVGLSIWVSSLASSGNCQVLTSHLGGWVIAQVAMHCAHYLTGMGGWVAGPRLLLVHTLSVLVERLPGVNFAVWCAAEMVECAVNRCPVGFPTLSIHIHHLKWTHKNNLPIGAAHISCLLGKGGKGV